MGKIVRNEGCPQCIDNGRDSTRNHLMVFEDGGKFCNRCKYREGPDSDERPMSRLRSKKSKDNRPSFEDILSSKTLDLKARGLPKRVLKEYNTKTLVDPETGDIKEVYFGYTRKGKVVTYKGRRIDIKEFLPTVGDKFKDLDIFGSHLWNGPKNCIVLHEGECLVPECEVLTPEGWVTIEDYDPETMLVGQVSEQNGLEFVKPLAKVWKKYDGNIVHYVSGSYKFAMTENHDMVRLHKKKGWIKAKKDNYYNLPIPRTFPSNQSGLDISDLDIRLQIMLSADFSFRKEGDIYGAFSKDRKIQRASHLLTKSGIKYSSKLESSGKTNFYIHRSQGLDKFTKLFDMSWLGKLSKSQCDIILEEMLLWDGNSVPNRNQIEYSSKYYHNATFIQTVAHMAGYVSTIIHRSNQWGEWYKVSILFNKKASSTQKGYELKPYSGMVGCVTVPSGMIAVRYKGSISVTGNCDCMSGYYILDKYNRQRGLDYIPHVGSVANGAQGAAKEIVANWSLLKKYNKVILCFDNDEPGQKAIREVAKAIPAKDLHKLHIMSLPSEFKDANDVLMAKKLKVYINAFFAASQYTPSQVVKGSNISRESLQKPLRKGLATPWPGIDAKLKGMRPGELTIITGGSGVGKTTFTRAIHYQALAEHKQRVLGIYLEDGRPTPDHPMKAAQSLIALHNNIALPRLRLKPKLLSKAAWESSYDDLIATDRSWFIDHFGGMSVDELMEQLMYAHTTIGADVVILDHISMLFSGQRHSETGNERKDIDLLMTELAKFCSKTGVSIYAISHISKGAQRQDKDGKRYIEVQSLDDLRGSSAIGQLSWNVIALNKGEGNRIIPLILKNREWGNLGACPALEYSSKTGWLTEVEDEDDGD